MATMKEKDWDRLSEIIDSVEIPSHKEALHEIIMLGKAHCLFEDKFLDLLEKENITVNRGDINMHMDAMQQWIFYIMPQVVPLPILKMIQEEIFKDQIGGVSFSKP